MTISTMRPTITIGEDPLPGYQVPTFDVLEYGRVVGSAGARPDLDHPGKRCWTASVCANPANMNQSPDRTLYGVEGWYYLEAPTRDLLCRTIARRFAEYRRRRQVPVLSEGRGSWWSGLRSGCRQLLASLHH